MGEDFCKSFLFGNDINSTDKWLLTWDDYRPDYMINISENERNKVEALLKDEGSYFDLERIISYCEYKARMYSHRNYEIWIINISSEVTYQQLQEAFKYFQSSMTSLIRSKGLKIYL